MKEHVKSFQCSFCKRKKEEVEKLIAGKDQRGAVSFICDVCTNTCYNALQKNKSRNKSLLKDSLTPQYIFDQLEKHVRGQEMAKKSLAVAAYNHFKRISHPDLNISKSNILMIGKSGSGKTFLVETLANILDIPCVTTDVTELTQAGYTGGDISGILEKLYYASGEDVEKAEKGIVFLDEIDKIHKTNNLEGHPDVSGAGVQQGLLKLIEGKEETISINSKKGYSQENIIINTKNILFICAGAFERIVKIIESDTEDRIGFHSKVDNKTKYSYLIKKIKSDHLIKFGMLREFIGRLPILVTLDELQKQDLVDILYKPENSLVKQYQNLLKIKDNASLEFTECALDAIATRAIEQKSGARSLKSIIENILREVMFQLPSTKKNSTIIINSDVVLEKKPADIKHKKTITG